MWSFKRIYYGERKILNRTRVNELIQSSCLMEPLTIFDDWFRHISVVNDSPEMFLDAKQPFPDLLLCQKPKSKFALHLSAGVDSALLALLYDQDGVDYLVCTVKGADDIEYVISEKFINHSKLKGKLHHIAVSPQEAFEVAKKILPQLNEPLMDPAVVLSYILSKKAKELGHSLVVTGDGADVVFGYPSFGKADLRTLAIWKTIEPAEILNLKALLPYSSPDLQMWGENYITESDRNNKVFLRKYAQNIGLPEIVIEKKKMGWVGHDKWCDEEVYTEMYKEILHSPFLKILSTNRLNNLTGSQRLRQQINREIIIREYAVIKWLEANCSPEIEVIDGESYYSRIKQETNKKQKATWYRKQLWIYRKLKTLHS